MAIPTKTALATDPIALQLVAAGANVLGSVLDFTTKFSGAIHWHFSPVAATAAAFATMLQLLCANKDGADTVDDAWDVLQEWLSPTANGVLVSSTVNGTAAASTVTLTAGSPTLFQDHYIRGATDNEAGGEWIYPIAQSGTTVTLRAALKNSYVNQNLWSQAAKFRFEQDFSNLKKYKVCVFNNRGGTERDTVNRVRIITLDSVDG
jgi:hypothetical protein